MTIAEKVAYLKGLADGLDLDKDPSKEGKLISKIIDILEDIGLAVEDLEEEVEAIFKTPRRIAAVNAPEVVLMVGVNGVGKTTTIAKLAYRARMQGKKVLIVDDVISTGGSLSSLENLVRQAGGEIVGKMTILAEGDAIGAVMVVSKESKGTYGEGEVKLSQTAANFLGKQMEN